MTSSSPSGRRFDEQTQQVHAEIRALIAEHRERKRHDRMYLAHLDAEERMLDKHMPVDGHDSACGDCGTRWPCEVIKTLRDPRHYWEG
ncbi:hypothetical protein [Nocardia amamiensis]|uniref:hypothetical protein n=1 Tax=Nocardia amamiensis TaxID=404578 RepID=UPI000A71C98E|nr:hypothetical protein [Nocardia amamiensis]